MASPQERDVATMNRYLVAALDYGTVNSTASWALRTTNQPIPPTYVQAAWLSESEQAHTPQTVAYDEQGNFYWGLEVQDALHQRKLVQSQVFEQIKLLLCDYHQQSDVVQELSRQLKSASLEPGKIINQHIACLVRTIKDQMKEHVREIGGDFTEEEVDTLPFHLIIAVPQMWKAPANRIMSQAGKAAEADVVTLVSEAKCAAALYAALIMGKETLQIQIGDQVMVADMGGGTVDLVVFRYAQDNSAGAKIRIEVVGEPKGAVCGSEMVTQEFDVWVRERAGPEGFEDKCRSLGLTTLEVFRQANRAFRVMKHEFRGPHHTRKSITITGIDPSNEDEPPTWIFSCDGFQIERFFQRPLRGIYDLIDEQLTPDIGFLVLPGGFSHNNYVMQQLNNRYGNSLRVIGHNSNFLQGLETVSFGAILRFSEIQQTLRIPNNDRFGIGRQEKFDKDVHIDAVRPDGSGKPGIVKNDEDEEGVKVVANRWCSILSTGNQVQQTWQLHITDQNAHLDRLQKRATDGAGEGRRAKKRGFKTEGRRAKRRESEKAIAKRQYIETPVYWTERTDVAEHDPIFEDGKLRRGIFKWGEPIKMKIPDLGALGFTAVKRKRPQLVYYWYSRITVETVNDGNVTVTQEILGPAPNGSIDPFDDNGELVEGVNILTVNVENMSLCEAKFNPMMREVA